MKFNFRKIASVLASAVMIGSTLGIAAAANYPAPFVAGSAADVAIVYGSNMNAYDVLAAGGLSTNLQQRLTGGTSGTTGSVTGEAAALFTGGTKLYINDTLNSVKSVVTKTEMPTTLKDGSFSGISGTSAAEATFTQSITLGSNPILTYAKQPTSSDDPNLAYALSTTAGLYLYNASVTFNKAINFTHTDSKNQDLTMFGQKFTVSSSTDSTNLVLLKSATALTFSSTGTTSQEVTVESKVYTVELVSASTTTATVKVTNDAGTSDQKEVSEGSSKKINGLTVAVTQADSNNQLFTARVVAGAEKMTFTDGQSVTYGESDTVIDGTRVGITGGLTATTKLTVSVYAADSDHDAFQQGKSFVDPVFKSFKVDFPGLNIPDTNTTAREDISIAPSGDDKMTLSMANNRGDSISSQQYAYNATKMGLYSDTNYHQIHVNEMDLINASDMVVVGNEDEGYLLKLTTLVNQSSGYSQDSIKFTDVFNSNNVFTATLTAEGTGTISIGGKIYDVYYNFDSTTATEARQARLGYPDSSANDMIIYPTIQTSKGAKLFFYKPLTINLTNWDNAGYTGVNISGLKIPNGAKSYQTIGIKPQTTDPTKGVNVTCGTTVTNINTTWSTGINWTGCTLTSTGLSFNITMNDSALQGASASASGAAPGFISVYLMKPDGTGAVTDPALVFYEEKDDNNQYQAVIVTTEQGASADDGIGVNDIFRTWSLDSTWNAITLASDSKKQKEADLWGAIALKDSTDSDQIKTTISYPDEQVYAQVYIAANDASITAGTAGTTGSATALGDVLAKDSEITTVQSKNLIVIGGSCINSVARRIIDSNATAPVCGAAFTAKTGVGAGQFLIKSVTSPYQAGKVALLVAGYEAEDTTAAATFLKTGTVATDVGTVIKKVTTTLADVTTA